MQHEPTAVTQRLAFVLLGVPTPSEKDFAFCLGPCFFSGREFVRSFVRSFARSSARSFVCAFVRFVRCVGSLVRSFVRSFVRWYIGAFAGGHAVRHPVDAEGTSGAFPMDSRRGRPLGRNPTGDGPSFLSLLVALFAEAALEIATAIVHLARIELATFSV